MGSVIAVDGGTEEDVKTRIGKARTAFNILNNIWKSKNSSLKTKLQIFNSNVKTVLPYGSKTWRTTTNTTNKLQTFINHCLRRILGMTKKRHCFAERNVCFFCGEGGGGSGPWFLNLSKIPPCVSFLCLNPVHPFLVSLTNPFRRP